MTRYQLFTIKRYAEQVLMYPFVLLGRIIAMFTAKQTDYDLFFFIPIYGVGGAEYVNAKILDALPGRKILLVFTRKSHETTARHLFEHEHVTIHDISRWTDNKFIYWANFICRGYYARLIRRNKRKATVFIGQCNFAYKLTPHLYRRNHVIELIHLYDKVFCNVWLPFVSFLDARLCVSQAEIDKFIAYAQQAGVPEKYVHRFRELRLFVEIPPEKQRIHRNDGNLHVFYAGRGSTQKRLWLSFEIARRVKQSGLPVTFHYVGNFADELPEDINDIAHYSPPVNIGNDMYDYIRDKDVLLLTSQSEGFPVVLLEAMHFGIVPVITPVGGMPLVIKQYENGILLDNQSEEAVITSGVAALEKLCADRMLYDRLSAKEQETFRSLFSREKFDTFVRGVFNEQV